MFASEREEHRSIPFVPGVNRHSARARCSCRNRRRRAAGWTRVAPRSAQQPGSTCRAAEWQLSADDRHPWLDDSGLLGRQCPRACDRGVASWSMTDGCDGTRRGARARCVASKASAEARLRRPRTSTRLRLKISNAMAVVASKNVGGRAEPTRLQQHVGAVENVGRRPPPVCHRRTTAFPTHEPLAQVNQMRRRVARRSEAGRAPAPHEPWRSPDPLPLVPAMCSERKRTFWVIASASQRCAGYCSETQLDTERLERERAGPSQ
jgi:hypothetical protein